MFWSLFLAHLIADYPLQTDAMVQAKKTIPGLSLHVAIHLLTMGVILFGLLEMDGAAAWVSVLIVTACHFGIDTWKNVLSRLKPEWVIGGYFQDQLLHLASILLVAGGYAYTTGEPLLVIPAPWIIYAGGFILATHAWFVTERVLTYRHEAYQQWITAQFWPRMMSRVVLFSLVGLGWSLWGLVALAGALSLHWFDLASRYRWRAMLIDVSLVLGVILIVQWILVRS